MDSLIVIPNEKLLEGLDKPLTMKESFALADDILKTGVKSISDLIVEEGYINLDFADVSTIMKGAGYAHMAIGHGSGKDKAKEAAAAVIASPLLETSIAGAKRLLINIAMSEDILSSDVDTATKMITDQAAENVEFILNTTVQEIRGEQMVESLRVLNKVTGEESELAVSGIFVAVGQIAQNEKFADVVQLDEGGFIVAGEDCKTSEAGIYAAGDCRTKEVRQLTTAAADGAVAALAACKYIADIAEK